MAVWNALLPTGIWRPIRFRTAFSHRLPLPMGIRWQWWVPGPPVSPVRGIWLGWATAVSYTHLSDRLFVMTDDGSNGNKGFVTVKLQELLDAGEDYDLVIAIGPLPMMRAVAELTRPYGIKTLVSMNPIMIDGTGMCGGCRLTVGGETKFACVDGPEFDALVSYTHLVVML